MTLDVIIVNYNVKHYLAQCLDAVERAIVGVEAEVWVVDNCSADGSVDYLEPRYPWVNFVRGEENVGFSRANNRAIRMSHGKYVLLLNPDTIVTSKTIRDCIHLLDEHPEIGSTGVSMYNADGTFARESKRGVPTAKVSFYKMVGLSALFPSHPEFARYHLGYLDPLEPNEIEIISGAFNMLRREALDQIGLLDEDFFMYGEDIDLSYRMLKGGWKNWYLPSPMLHYKGESAHPSTIRYVNVFYQAMIIFYDKHFGGRFSLSAWLIRIAVYLKALMTLVLHFFRYCKSLFVRNDGQTKVWLLCDDAVKGTVADRLAAHGIFVAERQEEADIMLFQKSMHTYDEMLEALIRQEGGRRFQLGVFDDVRDVFVLPREIIE